MLAAPYVALVPPSVGQELLPTQVMDSCWGGRRGGSWEPGGRSCADPLPNSSVGDVTDLNLLVMEFNSWYHLHRYAARAHILMLMR